MSDRPDEIEKLKVGAGLEAVRHSLCFYGGLVATDRPDLHDIDTDRDKNTVWEIDTQNEIAMVDEAIAQTAATRAALELCDDILGFNEGSEETSGGRVKPHIWINAEGPGGDFQRMLKAVRDALATLDRG